MREQQVSRGVWDRVVDRLWPVTFGIGIVMAIGVIAFLGFAFWLVFGTALFSLPGDETWGWLQE